MMIKMKDLFGLINDLENFIFCIGFKLTLKEIVTLVHFL